MVLAPTTVGERIREARQAVGLTQQEVADAVGVTPQAVSRWERGETLPDLSQLPALCALLKRSSDALLAIQVTGDGTADWHLERLAAIIRETPHADRDEAAFTMLPRILFEESHLGPEGRPERPIQSGCTVGHRRDRDGRIIGVAMVHSKGLAFLATRDLLEELSGREDWRGATRLQVLLEDEAWSVVRQLFARGTATRAELDAAVLGGAPDAAITRLLEAGLVKHVEAGYGLENGAMVAAVLLHAAASGRP